MQSAPLDGKYESAHLSTMEYFRNCSIAQGAIAGAKNYEGRGSGGGYARNREADEAAGEDEPDSAPAALRRNEPRGQVSPSYRMEQRPALPNVLLQWRSIHKW